MNNITSLTATLHPKGITIRYPDKSFDIDLDQMASLIISLSTLLSIAERNGYQVCGEDHIQLLDWKSDVLTTLQSI